MAHYHLDRFFVPDDKNLYDMLDACHASVDKMWEYARDFGVIISNDVADIQTTRSYVARLPTDRNKLLQLYRMNSSEDREEKYSNQIIPDAIDAAAITAAANEVKQERTTDHHEQYVVRQTGDVVEITVNYIDPDFSKAEALQMRERQVKLTIERSGEGTVVRHHSTDKGDEIARSLLKKLIPDELKLKSVKALNFVGISDPKSRTKFFRDLANDTSGFILRDVPTLRVYRVPPKSGAGLARDDGDEAEDDENAEEGVATANIKKILLSGTDIMHCPEYVELEKRGFFISSMTWIAEQPDEKQEHYEFFAAFNNPDNPTNINYSVTGKYTRSDAGDIRTYKAGVTKFERLALMKALEQKAFALYEELQKASGNQ